MYYCVVNRGQRYYKFLEYARKLGKIWKKTMKKMEEKEEKYGRKL